MHANSRCRYAQTIDITDCAGETAIYIAGETQLSAVAMIAKAVVIVAVLLAWGAVGCTNNHQSDRAGAAAATPPATHLGTSGVSTCGGGPVAVYRGHEIGLASCAGAMGTTVRPALTVPVGATFSIKDMTSGYNHPASSNTRVVALASVRNGVLYLTAHNPGVATVTFSTIYCAVRPHARCPALRVTVTRN